MSQKLKLQKTAKTHVFLGSTAGLAGLLSASQKRKPPTWDATASEGVRPWPDLRAYAQQPARGPFKGRGQQERREEEKGKRREGNVGDEQDGVGG